MGIPVQPADWAAFAPALYLTLVFRQLPVMLNDNFSATATTPGQRQELPEASELN
jgi:hypothetical protein